MTPDNTGKNREGRELVTSERAPQAIPMGDPPGRVIRPLLAMEALLDGEAEAITRVAVEGRRCYRPAPLPRAHFAAAQGSACFILTSFARNCNRCTSPTAAIVAAVAAADITVAEGSELAKLVDTYVRAVEASDLDKRLRAIEERMAK
jgi:hypothetical protein